MRVRPSKDSVSNEWVLEGSTHRETVEDQPTRGRDGKAHLFCCVDGPILMYRAGGIHTVIN